MGGKLLAKCFPHPTNTCVYSWFVLKMALVGRPDDGKSRQNSNTTTNDDNNNYNNNSSMRLLLKAYIQCAIVAIVEQAIDRNTSARGEFSFRKMAR